MRLLLFVIFVAVFAGAAVIFIDLPPFGGYLVGAAAFAIWTVINRILPIKKAPAREPTGAARAPIPRTMAAFLLAQAGFIVVLVPSFLVFGMTSRLVWFGIIPACTLATFAGVYLAIRADRSRAHLN